MAQVYGINYQRWNLRDRHVSSFNPPEPSTIVTHSNIFISALYIVVDISVDCRLTSWNLYLYAVKISDCMEHNIRKVVLRLWEGILGYCYIKCSTSIYHVSNVSQIQEARKHPVNRVGFSKLLSESPLKIFGRFLIFLIKWIFVSHRLPRLSFHLNRKLKQNTFDRFCPFEQNLPFASYQVNWSS